MLRQSISGVFVASLVLLMGSQRATFYNQNYSAAGSLNACAVSAWAMTEGSGLTLVDSSVNGNTATINTSGAVTWTANDIKTGATTPVWSGTGWATAANVTPTNFDGTHAFSVFVWEKTTQAAETAFVGTMTNRSPGSQGWELMGQGSAANDIWLIISNSLGTHDIWARTLNPSPYRDGSLHMIGATYNGSGVIAGVVMYWDGSVRTPATIDDTLAGNSAASGLPVTLGAINAGVFNEYVGSMAFVEIYNCVLTPTQVSLAYNGGVPNLF